MNKQEIIKLAIRSGLKYGYPVDCLEIFAHPSVAQVTTGATLPLAEQAESSTCRHSSAVEHCPCSSVVAGSIPAAGTNTHAPCAQMSMKPKADPGEVDQ